MKLSMRQLSQSFTQLANQFVTVQGWIRTNRSQKEFGFISFNDGSTLATLQIVYDRSLPNFDEVAKWRVGCSLTITGKVVLTPQNKQA